MIDAAVNIAGVLSRFQRMRKRDQRKVFSEAKRPVRMELRAIDSSQTGPDGKWPGRAASTMERRSRGRRRGGRGKLLGRLTRAIKITSGPTFVRATSLVRWSNAQKLGLRVGRGAKLRARNFMWIPRRLRIEIKKMLKAAIRAAFAGR